MGPCLMDPNGIYLCAMQQKMSQQLLSLIGVEGHSTFMLLDGTHCRRFSLDCRKPKNNFPIGKEKIDPKT